MQLRPICVNSDGDSSQRSSRQSEHGVQVALTQEIDQEDSRKDLQPGGDPQQHTGCKASLSYIERQCSCHEKKNDEVVLAVFQITEQRIVQSNHQRDPAPPHLRERAQQYGDGDQQGEIDYDPDAFCREGWPAGQRRYKEGGEGSIGDESDDGLIAAPYVHAVFLALQPDPLVDALGAVALSK